MDFDIDFAHEIVDFRFYFDRIGTGNQGSWLYLITGSGAGEVPADGLILGIFFVLCEE
jgi:hypothetical protein